MDIVAFNEIQNSWLCSPDPGSKFGHQGGARETAKRRIDLLLKKVERDLEITTPKLIALNSNFFGGSQSSLSRAEKIERATFRRDRLAGSTDLVEAVQNDMIGVAKVKKSLKND